METGIQRERHAETETGSELEAETHEGRARNHIRRVERQQRQPGRGAAQTWKSVCEYRGGPHMNKSQRQLPGTEGRDCLAGISSWNSTGSAQRFSGYARSINHWGQKKPVCSLGNSTGRGNGGRDSEGSGQEGRKRRQTRDEADGRDRRKDQVRRCWRERHKYMEKMHR